MNRSWAFAGATAQAAIWNTVRNTAGSAVWVAATLAMVGAIASPAAAAGKKVESVEGITEYRFDNGLQLLLYPDDSQPTVTVNLTVFVGSRHEGYGETGMAHLLEHMVFKGTPTHPKIPKELQEHGAHFNGTTWVDRTNYYETLPASEANLDFALGLEADRLVNSNVAREDLLSEMTVVRNEFEQGENNPTAILYQRLLATAFEWHNYGKPTIGNRTDIERVPIDRLKAFYVKYYQPDNVMLMIAGKFDEQKALALVERYFATIPRPKRKLDQTYTEEPPQDGERTVSLRRVGDVGLVGALYHVVAGPHPDIVALDVLGQVLGNAPSGRLYKALVEPHKAASVASDVSGWHDPGVFEVLAEVRKGDSLDEALDIMLSTTENLAEHPVTAEEVDRARTKMLKQRELNAADSSKLAIDLSNWASQGDWRLYFLFRDRLLKVTADDVNAAAAKYLLRSNRTSGRFVPTDKPDRAIIPPTPDLAKMFEGYTGQKSVSAGEVFDTSPAAIEQRSSRVKVTKGIKAALLPKKTRGETVHLRLTLRFGTAKNLAEYRSACELLPALMLHGTKKLSRQEFQDQLDSNVATLHAEGDGGLARFTLETKRANLPAALELLRQALREPALLAEEFDVLKQENLANLEEQLTDPRALSFSLLRQTLNPYPKDDIRYTPGVQQEIDELQALTVEKVRELYAQFLGSQAGELAIVGDFDSDETLELVRKTLADWNAPKPYERIAKVVFSDVPGGRSKIDTPDKANAVYVGGEVFAVDDSDPDYAGLLIGNYIFGGGALSSRLGDRVRQKEGLSYGVGSFFGAESLDRRASVTMFAIFNPKNVAKVEQALAEEFARLLSDGVTPEELARGKKGYLQDQSVSRSNDGTLAAILSDTIYANRTMQYYVDRDKRIEALTPALVQKALSKYFDPKRLAVVVAGDFSDKTEGAAEAGAKTAE